MGEPRGKLEALITELEQKKAETLRVLQEYDLLMPHLQQGLTALDEAGFTEVSQPAMPTPPQPVPPLQEAPPPKEAAPAPEPAPEPEAEAEPEAAEAEDEKAPAEPARRSIASLVGDEAEAAQGKG